MDKYIHRRKVTMLSNSRGVINSLDSSVINSEMVYDYRRCFNEMAKRETGNCRADELARRGTTIELSNKFFTLRITSSTCGLKIENAIVDLINRGRLGS